MIREEELREIAANVNTLGRKVEHVHVLFNTNYQDQGQRAAKALASLLA